MNPLFITLALVVGFPLLVYSAQWFCDSVVLFAKKINVPVVIIALTLVPIGTSAPELAVSLNAALKGNADIVYGSVIGSNIANLTVVCIILGFFYATAIAHNFRAFELPALFCFYLLLAVSLFDYKVTASEGTLLLVGLGIYLWLLLRSGLQDDSEEKTDTHGWLGRLPAAVLLLIVCITLVGVLISAEVLIWGATSLARILGMSDLLISLTLLASGTSLPEIIISVVAAHRSRFDIAIANILGSNLYNIALIIGLASLITPIDVAQIAVWRDFWFAYAMLLTVLVCLYFFRTSATQINKITATCLSLLYACYLTLLVLVA